MGFFEKTGGDGFFQKVEIMFGNEFNIRPLWSSKLHLRTN
jgi:hypothetical protein